MDINYYAQILILLAYMFLVFSVSKKEEKQILFFQIITCFFFSIAFLLLGAITGALINILGIIRNITYYKFEQENNLFLLLLFIILAFVLTYSSFDGLFSLFPLLSFSCYSFLLWKNNNKVFIYGNVITSLFWLLYNIFVSAYLGIVGESIIILASLYFIIRRNNKIFKI